MTASGNELKSNKPESKDSVAEVMPESLVGMFSSLNSGVTDLIMIISSTSNGSNNPLH